MSYADKNPEKDVRRLKIIGSLLPGLLLLAGVSLLALIFSIGQDLQPAAAAWAQVPASESPTSTAGPLSTPAPLPLTPAVSVEQAVPAAGAASLVLTLPPESAGWASSLDGRTHFGFPNIHAGLLKGHVYQGALQFDLSSVPSGASLAYASLELTALDGQYLGQAGAWQLHLLDPAIQADWTGELGYETLRAAPALAAFTPALSPADLARSRTHVFNFGPEQLAALQQSLAAGAAFFRLAGPAGGADSLFTWDSGCRKDQLLATGPVLRLAAGLPPTPAPVLVTSTPTPENVITAAALAATATQAAAAVGTYTPVPAHWVTPVVVTPIPSPANTATAAYQAQAATAEAFLFGTATPTALYVWTATPLPPGQVQLASAPGPTPTATATPVLVALAGELATPWATWTPTATPAPIPTVLVGKIAFLSNRSGGPEPLKEPLVYVIDPDGGNLAVLTDRSAYDLAVARDSYSPDQRFRVFVKNAIRFDDKRVPALYFYDSFYQVEQQITQFGAGIAYEPAWSPAGEQITFVSNDSGNDEIWLINRDGTGARQLTLDGYSWWDKHPSWSPDGSRIVFWSNRTGNRQIWVMNADGSNPYSLSRTGYDDWDPVWIKYTDPVRAER